MKHSLLLVLMGMLMAQLCFAAISLENYLAGTRTDANLDYVNFQVPHDALTHFK